MSITPSGPTPPADWYSAPGAPHQLRYWDGRAWTEHYAPAAAAAPQPNVYNPPQPTYAPQQTSHATGPMTSANMNVHRDVIYTRQQQGHSLILWIALSLFLFFPVIGLIYYSASPNHYWHA